MISRDRERVAALQVSLFFYLILLIEFFQPKIEIAVATLFTQESIIYTHRLEQVLIVVEAF
jgi:hypothetical protein